MRTDTEILIAALRLLAREIPTDDGVANMAISEAADRLEELEMGEYICKKCNLRKSDTYPRNNF